MGDGWSGPLEKIDAFRYEIPRSYKPAMRTSGLIFIDEPMMALLRQDQAPEQVANVATMPGIVGKAMAMPDIHWGYGFPIGGVAAFDHDAGVISPGGIGYDINCGVRLLRTNLAAADIAPNLRALVDACFQNVPSGVGEGGITKVSRQDLSKLATEGVAWSVDKGYSWSQDTEHIEARGRLADADFSKVSERATTRGKDQLGSLGAGNHFVEIQRVDRIYDERAAKALGIDGVGRVCVMIHTGSRGFGHQIATDYIETCERVVKREKIELPDLQLACAPIGSKEGQDYWRAMCCGANFAWNNRQLITFGVRNAFSKVLGESAESLGVEIVYDVCHNIGKIEEHAIDGTRRKVVVHRKGATRAFPAGHPETPAKYRDVGQPVLIPGDMGTCSFVLVGLPGAMTSSFGSSCHGAGRQMSRKAATRKYQANDVVRSLEQSGIYLRAASRAGIVEEAPGAYKNVEGVVRIAEGAGLTRIVARMVPLGVVKG
ncbi:MAG TPA: RtcB family protein [Thermoplasmata archaeon]|nr:RtcB family protein [Thermoplasmata archaeon]